MNPAELIEAHIRDIDRFHRKSVSGQKDRIPTVAGGDIERLALAAQGVMVWLQCEKDQWEIRVEDTCHST